MMKWIIRTASSDNTEHIGEVLGSYINPPELIELRSDLGGGKTTFTRGLVRGLGSKDRIGSPTYTLKKVYRAGKLEIHHFDFYRLSEPGVVSAQLKESLNDPAVITVVEWAGIVKGMLPKNSIVIKFQPVPDNEDERVITFEVPESKMQIIEKLRTELAELEP
jgi:tRNA threonylcarbamoyladenosine biosynthesis protein TsaE